MANFKEGDYGRNILINAKFDLSSNTDLQIKFTKPDQTTLLVDASDGVVAPSTDVTINVDDVPTLFLANEYFLYSWKIGDLDKTGNWVANGIYIEGVSKGFCGDAVTFFVLPC